MKARIVRRQLEQQKIAKRQATSLICGLLKGRQVRKHIEKDKAVALAQNA